MKLVSLLLKYQNTDFVIAYVGCASKGIAFQHI